MNISVLPGHVLLSRDPLIDTSPSGLIVLPVHQVETSAQGYVHLHEPGAYWDSWGGEPPLTGRRVVIEKHSGRPFTLNGLELWLIPEHSVLAVEEDMCSETN